MENIVSSIIPAPNICEEEKKRQKKAQINQKQRERRANLSDEKRALIRAKNAIQHRNKYQEKKAFLKRHLDDNQLNSNNRSTQCGRNKNDADEDEDEDTNADADADADIHADDVHAEVEDEDEVEVEDNKAAADRVNALLLSRKKRNEKNRNYKKAKYEQLKDAEKQLQAISKGDSIGDNNVQQLQLLANRRLQILEHHRQYAQTYRQNHQQQHRRWVRIQQVWDEDNPCR